MSTEGKIKEYIKQSGLKQNAVAKKAGIKPRDLNMYLNGYVRMRAETLYAICDALMVSPETFAPDRGEA